MSSQVPLQVGRAVGACIWTHAREGNIRVEGAKFRKVHKTNELLDSFFANQIAGAISHLPGRPRLAIERVLFLITAMFFISTLLAIERVLFLMACLSPPLCWAEGCL